MNKFKNRLDSYKHEVNLNVIFSDLNVDIEWVIFDELFKLDINIFNSRDIRFDGFSFISNFTEML